jgi:hypothetical protein
MPAKYVATATALVLLVGATMACAEDVVPRPRSAVFSASEGASPATCPRGEIASGALIDRDTGDKSKIETATGVAAKAVSHPRQVGADGGGHDDSTVSAAPSTASTPTDPAPIGEGAPAKANSLRKAGGALRWQSLLPGVMK